MLALISVVLISATRFEDFPRFFGVATDFEDFPLLNFDATLFDAAIFEDFARYVCKGRFLVVLDGWVLASAAVAASAMSIAAAEMRLMMVNRAVKMSAEVRDAESCVKGFVRSYKIFLSPEFAMQRRLVAVSPRP